MYPEILDIPHDARDCGILTWRPLFIQRFSSIKVRHKLLKGRIVLINIPVYNKCLFSGVCIFSFVPRDATTSAEFRLHKFCDHNN